MEPNSGFTITSPRSRKAAIASSGLSQTTVSGVGMPHCSSRQDVQNLSTVRSIARGEFITRTPALLQAVQRVHPEDDLLQRARRDDPGEHGVGAVQLGRAAPETGAAADRRGEPFVGHDRPRVPARLDRAGQLPGVPALPGGEDDDVHALPGLHRDQMREARRWRNWAGLATTFLKPGVAVPFFSASIDGKYSSAWR